MSDQNIRSESYNHMVNMIEEARVHGKLVRLSIVKSRGIQMNIPCKILNFDEESRNLAVYHVDDKQVHIVNMNEIDDFIISS